MFVPIPLRADWVAATAAAASYTLARVYETRQLGRRVAVSTRDVFIYQMGKVGSSAMVKGIRRAAPQLMVHHVHRAAEGRLRQFEAFVRQEYRNPLVDAKARRSLVRQVVAAQYLRRTLAEPRPDRKPLVISLVRGPVGRNVSDFFEVLRLVLHYDVAGELARRAPDEVFGELEELFLKKYPDHDMPLVFFEAEIEETLGIDVYAEPFERERGWQLYRTERVDLLVVRVEDLDGSGVERVRTFLGVPALEIDRANVGADKDYADVYRMFKEKIRLPDWYLDRMYASRYATHFYSPEEIDRLRRRWIRPADSGTDS